MFVQTLLHLAGALLITAPALDNAIPMHASGGWLVDVGPGLVTMDDAEIALADPVRL